MAKHELLAQQAHGAQGGGAHRGFAQAVQQAAAAGRAGEFFGRPQREAGCGAEKAVAGQRMGQPVAFVEAVGDQRGGGGGVGHAQQGFGQAHQRQAFTAGNGILAQQRFDREQRSAAGADLLDQLPCAHLGAGAGRHLQRRAREQGGDGGALVAIRIAERCVGERGEVVESHQRMPASR